MSLSRVSCETSLLKRNRKGMFFFVAGGFQKIKLHSFDINCLLSWKREIS